MISVDRIEGDRCVLDVDGELVDFPTSALPSGASEGSVLVLEQADSDTQQRLLDDAKARLERLRSRDPGTDEIDL